MRKSTKKKPTQGEVEAFGAAFESLAQSEPTYSPHNIQSVRVLEVVEVTQHYSVTETNGACGMGLTCTRYYSRDGVLLAQDGPR